MQTYVSADDLPPATAAAFDFSPEDASASLVSNDERAALTAPLLPTGVEPHPSGQPDQPQRVIPAAADLSASESAAFGESASEPAQIAPPVVVQPPVDAVSTSEAELLALSQPPPVAVAGPERVRRRRRAVSAPPPPPEPVAIVDEDEMGPDPNDGEPDDGKPLDWRAARSRAATRRRPPPRRFG
jgi:hypothetical protein